MLLRIKSEKLYNTLGKMTLQRMLILLATIALCLLCLLDYYKRQFWTRKGVPQTSSTPFFGHMLPVVAQKTTIVGVYHVDSLKFAEAPYFGVYEFWRPTLVVQDFNLIEHILIKDFSHFLDHPRWVFDVRSVMHESLLNMKGDKWRAWRYNMIPWFTSGRMKSLFPQVFKNITIPNGEFEAMTFLRQVAADTISTFFGIEVSDKKELMEMNKRFHDVSNFRYYKIMLVEHFAKYTDLIGITLANRSTDQFFRNFTKSILFSNTDHSLVQRMQKLLDDKELHMRKKDLYTKSVDDEIYSYEVTEDILISIAAQFFVAGLDTTSNSMTWLFYELALHPEAQSKAREEIRTCIKKHGDWTYDAVHDMKYVAACINESLRLHPPIPFIFRTCTTKYVTPDGLTIDKGTKVVIPALTLQMNPSVYPEPELYKPERFICEEKNTNLKWLPFGEGPRKCVGIRFSQMEMRTVVARLLENHELIFTENTKFPVVNNDRTFFSRPLNKLFVKLQKVA